MTPVVAVIIWIAFLLLSVPYVGRVRHPAAKPLAAYFVFVGVFSLVGAALFYALGAAAAYLGLAAALATPIGGAAFLLAVFVPAFVAARWQIRRAPGRPVRPPD
jgi:hypothetical protein